MMTWSADCTDAFNFNSAKKEVFAIVRYLIWLICVFLG